MRMEKNEVDLSQAQEFADQFVGMTFNTMRRACDTQIIDIGRDFEYLSRKAKSLLLPEAYVSIDCSWELVVENFGKVDHTHFPVGADRLDQNAADIYDYLHTNWAAPIW